MGVGYSPSIVAKGLVLCLDAGDPKSYNGSGTVWYDRSGKGNNGTMLNMTFADKNMIFNGSNGQVNTSVIPNQSEGTIAAWFNMDLLKNYNTIFDNALGANDWEMWVYDYATLRFRTTASQADIVVSVNGLVANRWYFMTLTWDSSFGKVYMNGEFATSDAAAVGSRVAPSTLAIGGSINTRFDGKMGAFYIYNRALTPSEIKQNYNATKGRFGL